MQELSVVFVDGSFSKKLPKFQEISARIKKLRDGRYQADIEGSLQEFELSHSDNVIGFLPSSNFVIDLEIQELVSKLTSRSKINFSMLSEADISGTLELVLTFGFLTNSSCGFSNCDLSDFDLAYVINIDDEWVKGSAQCPLTFCGLSEIEYWLRTSNTVNIFTILNQGKILAPLSSLYLFSAISSGQKIDGGHELKFQF